MIRLWDMGKAWPPRDWRAWVALLGSILGCGLLVVLSVFFVLVIWRGGWSSATEQIRVEYLGQGLLLVLAGLVVMLVSLGMAINHRMLKISKHGLEAGGGDDAPKSV